MEQVIQNNMCRGRGRTDIRIYRASTLNVLCEQNATKFVLLDKTWVSNPMFWFKKFNGFKRDT